MNQTFEKMDEIERTMFLPYGGKAAGQRLLGPFDRADKFGKVSDKQRKMFKDKLWELDATQQKLLEQLRTFSVSQADSPAFRFVRPNVSLVKQYIQSAIRVLSQDIHNFSSICDANANPETILGRWKYEGHLPVHKLFFPAAVWLFGTLWRSSVGPGLFWLTTYPSNFTA